MPAYPNDSGSICARCCTQPGLNAGGQTVRLTGNSAHEYEEQIEALGPALSHGWQTKPSAKTGNPVYARPTVLVVYREDHKFLLDGVIPKPGQTLGDYDLIVASQPWRARTSAKFKAQKVLAPLVRSLAPGGRMGRYSPMARIRHWKSSTSCGPARLRSWSTGTNS